MSEIFDSFSYRLEQGLDKNNKLSKFRSEFTIPQCENNSDEASFEPNISSYKKIVLSTPQKSKFNPLVNGNAEDNIQNTSKQKNYSWGSGGLRVMFFITKFIKQMKNHSTQIKFKSLNHNILALISDSAADSDTLLKKQTKTQIIISNLKLAIDHIPVVEPDSIFKIIWDIFLLAQIILNILYIPMKLGFGFKNEGLIYSILLETMPSITFILDIVLNFFTAFYSKGQIHRNKGEIFQNYIHFQLWWDLLIAIPFILSSFQVKYTEYILLLRVTKVKSMIESIEEVVNPSVTMQTILELFKSVFLVLFVSHSCACLWNMIGQMELDQGKDSWLISKELVNEDWDSRYISSLYFSTITTLTVGYGDIVPQTNLERIFVILMALVICGLFGYTISSIGNILRQLTEKEQIFKQKMMVLNNYLKKKQLNKQLILQVRKYFEYYFKMQDDNNEMGDNMMEALNKKLKQQVAIDLYHNMLLNSRLIKQTLSEKSVRNLCSYVREKRYAPEDVIEQQNDQANKLIFLLKGEINLICDQGNRETKLAIITAGRFIGEKEFIVQSRYNYTIRTIKFCQIAYITYEDFLKIIKEDSLEEENYQMLKDQMIFNEEKQNYGEVCYICKWTHQFTKCPLVFYNVNLDRARKKFMMTEDNKRQKFKRFFLHKFSNSLKFNQESALQFVVENNLLAIEDLTDQYLEQLGILQSKTLQSPYSSLKSNKTNSKNTSSESSEEDKSVKSKFSKLPTTNDQKKVKFVNQSPETEKRELNKQGSKLKPLNNNRRTFVKLSQIQTHRFSNVSIFSQDLAGLVQQFQQQSQQPINQTSASSSSNQQSSLQQSSLQQNSPLQNPNQTRKLRKNNSSSYQNIENQLAVMRKMQQTRQEIGQGSIQNLQFTQEDIQKIFLSESQTRIRVDLDIDRCFNSQNYFNQGNLSTVLMKLRKPKKTQRHIAQIENIIQKSKIRQHQLFQV